MNKIKVGATEIEVVALRPYAYVNGKSDKFLKIEVSASVADFTTLRNLLENTEETIEYYENENLMCTYVGYGKFEAQYKDENYTVEMHKNSIVEQMSALLTANERLTEANTALQETSDMLVEQNGVLVAQNEMLTLALTDVLESVIPNSLGEITEMLILFDERITTLETASAQAVTE